jgi:hypothetical protein
MKNVYEVLREKERNLIRLRTEVEALRLAAPLLIDPETDRGAQQPDLTLAPALQRNKWPLTVGSPGASYLDS